MPCVNVPRVPPIALKSPLSIAPPELPLPRFQAGWCCAIVDLEPPPLRVPIPPILIDLPLIQAIEDVIAQVDEAIDSIQPQCPRESAPVAT
jgi:hypothetical protein